VNKVLDQVVTDDYAVYNADCVDVVKSLPSNSIGYTIFSPPFASLYTYSASPRDMGNCADDDDFAAHFAHLVPELFRVTKPGRLLSFHCMNLPTSKARDGYIGLKDFRGDLIRQFIAAGWIFHSEVCIWKDPVTAMQRTKALGLLHKTIRKDSSMSRQGIPDYLVTMRKPGINDTPISHGDDLPVQLWQQYASPVWMDINPSRTLQKESARETPRLTAATRRDRARNASVVCAGRRRVVAVHGHRLRGIRRRRHGPPLYRRGTESQLLRPGQAEPGITDRISQADQPVWSVTC